MNGMTVDGWMALVGSIVTLLGTIITVRFTREQLKDDKRITIKPYLDLNLVTNINEFRNKLDLSLLDDSVFILQQLNSQYNQHISIIELKLENIGLGHAVDIKFTGIKGEIIKYFNVQNTSRVFNLKQNDDKQIYIFFTYNNMSLPIDIKEKGNYIYIEIEYKDILGNKYQKDIYFELEKLVYKSHDGSQFLYMSQNKEHFEEKLILKNQKIFR